MFSFLKKILSSKTFDLGRGHAFSSLFLCLSSIGRKKKSLLHTNIFTSNHTRASWRWIWTASNIRTQLSKQISVTMQIKKNEGRNRWVARWERERKVVKERPFSCLLFGSSSPAVNNTYKNKWHPKRNKKEWQKTDGFFFTIVWGGGSDYIDSDSYKMPGSIAHDVAGKYI